MPYIIAEAGLSHNGEFPRALEMVRMAHEAGCQAVKFQFLQPDELLHPEHGNATQREIFAKAALAEHDLQMLSESAHQLGLEFICSVFSVDGLDIAHRYCDAIKIASCDCTNAHLILAVASKARRMIISTGMCTMEQIIDASMAASNCGDVTLMHCVSAYPTNELYTNTRAIAEIARVTGRRVGLSDHSRGLVAAITAVSFGATMHEVHFSPDQDTPEKDVARIGIDALDRYVAAVSAAEWACGSAARTGGMPGETYANMRAAYYGDEYKAGEILTLDKLEFLRPWHPEGFMPSYVPLGRRLAQDVTKGQLVRGVDLK